MIHGVPNYIEEQVLEFRWLALTGRKILQCRLKRYENSVPNHYLEKGSIPALFLGGFSSKPIISEKIRSIWNMDLRMICYDLYGSLFMAAELISLTNVNLISTAAYRMVWWWHDVFTTSNLENDNRMLTILW